MDQMLERDMSTRGWVLLEDAPGVLHGLCELKLVEHNWSSGRISGEEIKAEAVKLGLRKLSCWSKQSKSIEGINLFQLF